MKKEQSIISRKGFALVEVILAVAVFALFVGAFFGSLIYGEESTALAGKRSRAVFLAEEGIEAVRNIKDEDFINLSDGTYGLDSSGSQWDFSGSQDTEGIFTRQIEISTVDANTKNIISNVSWQQNQQRSGLVSLNTYLTNWYVTSLPTTEAENLVVDISGVSISGNNVVGITLENTGESDIAIASIDISWSGVPGNRRLETISIDSTNVWTGNDKSVVNADISDVALTAGSGIVDINHLQYSGSISGITLSLTFNMSDGSSKTVLDIIP